MIRIAICDDFQVMRSEVKQHILAYAKKCRLEVFIYEYENGTDLLADNKEYDLVFMDYEFKNDEKNNGLSIAMKLRERQKNVTIIFLTSYSDVVYDSFEVGTFRFLVKPVEVAKFTKAMDDYLKTLEEEKILNIKVENVNRNIHTQEITYVEGAGKYCIIHLESGEKIECHETLAAIELRMPKDFFYRCQKSFLINFRYVKIYDNESLVLDSGEKIYLSRKKNREFSNLYLEYMSRYC